MKKLERLLVGISYTEEISLPVKAHILSYGERLAVLLLSYLIKEKGKRSLPMEADNIGMVTDQSFENATALLPEVNWNLVKNVAPFVNDGIIPIITGYFGQSKEGKITTFGRNGSDYSAAVVANALDAKVLEIWKDVNGFMSTDPKIVKEAKNIDRLSYYEAAELSYFGAKILYPRTVEPLIAKGIPLHIKNLCDPGLRGTLIQNGSKELKNIVKSITYNRNISVLKIYGPGVGYKPGIIERISRVEEVALVSVVGKGLLKRHGVAAKVFSAVARENINVEMISSGASEVASYFIVLEKDLEQTIRAVHKEFFN